MCTLKIQTETLTEYNTAGNSLELFFETCGNSGI